ncbi:MAG: hypothetical protein OXG08_06000 [Gammaproteobacteria bacterium]|nr:hypothetical protein [Gammaproteobacteria bacterium]
MDGQKMSNYQDDVGFDPEERQMKESFSLMLLTLSVMSVAGIVYLIFV